MSVQTINPTTEDILATYEIQSESSVQKAVEASFDAYTDWRKMPLESRIQCVKDFAQAMHSARVPMAEMMTKEMGKLLKDALSEVDKCVSGCQTLAEQFPKWHEELLHDLPKGYSVTRAPLGTILGIMPWNFPLWQAVRFAVPALLCGNSILLKHAPNTWGSALLMEGLFHQSFPAHLYTNLKIDVSLIPKILDDNRVRGVSLTGSVRAGKSVAEQAGARLKKCVLELGGSDAYIVLDDADVEQAAKICTESRLLNAGQSCVAAKRFIVTRKNVPQFTKAMFEIMEKKKFGDPADSKSDLGPLARKDLRDQLHKQVQGSIDGGAKLILGGKIPEQKGYFYPPSILTNVRPGTPAFDDELFGPVSAIIEATDDDHAIQLANRSRYGLGSAIFSRDVERAKQLGATEVESGMTAINDFIRSDAYAPFGGVKESGLGRELGKEGCFEFTNIKTLQVKA